jgi:hypothetical protein
MTTQTTQTTQDATRDAVDDARTAGRTTVSLLRDSGYATIGATDAAVSYVRHIGERATEARGALSALRVPTPHDVTETLRELGHGVEEQFASLAGRGRQVVASLQTNRETRAATERARVARSQVKAAATSVRRAGEAAGEAVEQAADEVGDRTDIEYADMTVDELRNLARARDIEGRSEMNKAELIEALRSS